MFGIRFRGHPNLKRILMWDGYPYYPLRKDFPLAGIPTELPETAVNADKVRTAPMLGGPFVAPSGTRSSLAREPRQADTVVENIERLKHPTKKEAGLISHGDTSGNGIDRFRRARAAGDGTSIARASG